jgi:nitrogenase molybdenum-iron protein NifN
MADLLHSPSAELTPATDDITTASRPRSKPASDYVSTTNACKLCTPLGACVAYRGIEGCVPLLHGSQGCSTYIRRYTISHFREPIDIASSNFSEDTAVFGGAENLGMALDNVTSKYAPAVIGVASTCLTETIGDDVPFMVRTWIAEREKAGLPVPAIVTASTPSYAGTHMDGFHAVVRAAVETFAQAGERGEHVALMPGFVSPADLRHLRELVAAFGLPAVLVPDYELSLDGPALEAYEKVPAGGTTIAELASTGSARAAIELGRTLACADTAAAYLDTTFGVRRIALGTPIGVRETDRFVAALEELTGRELAPDLALERGRLIDAYVDGHKYVSQRRAAVYGEEDLVVGLVSFLAEIGIVPVIAASGGESGRLAEAIAAVAPEYADRIEVVGGADFADIGERAAELGVDIVIGNSKGYRIARELGVPLVRVGFPIHDRMGANRLLHVGYRGAQRLFDEICNALIAAKQDGSPIGFAYI